MRGTLGGLTPGTTYTYRLHAANARGIATGFEATVRTSTSSSSDRTPPVLGSLKLTSRRFTVGRALTPLAAAARRGTTLRFKVSEAGTATIKVQRLRPGRRRAGRCVAPTNGLLHARRCTRARTFATLRRAVQAGSVTVPFSGRIGTANLSRRLPIGSYRFAVRATDNAGNRSDQETIGFAVVTRRA